MQKREVLWVIAVIITIVDMIVIFSFSAQSVAESDALSKGLAENLISMLPGLENMVVMDKLNHYLRKLAHFTLYFILGGGLTGVASKQKKFSAVALAILIGSIFAATDEFHQVFSDGRGPAVRDVLLDACGVAAGSAFAAFFRKCLYKWKILP